MRRSCAIFARRMLAVAVALLWCIGAPGSLAGEDKPQAPGPIGEARPDISVQHGVDAVAGSAPGRHVTHDSQAPAQAQAAEPEQRPTPTGGERQALDRDLRTALGNLNELLRLPDAAPGKGFAALRIALRLYALPAMRDKGARQRGEDTISKEAAVQFGYGSDFARAVRATLSDMRRHPKRYEFLAQPNDKLIKEYQYLKFRVVWLEALGMGLFAGIWGVALGMALRQAWSGPSLEEPSVEQDGSRTAAPERWRRIRQKVGNFIAVVIVVAIANIYLHDIYSSDVFEKKGIEIIIAHRYGMGEATAQQYEAVFGHRPLPL